MCAESQVVPVSVAAHATNDGDYKMIESLEISNFRGFQHVQLKKLSRVNILVGDNGSGKTALLESLFLTGGLGPEIYLRTRAWRGAGDKFLIGVDRDQYEALWKEIFFGLDQNRSVVIKFSDSESGERELLIYYDVAQTNLMPLDMGVRSSYESGDIHPITFEWRTEKADAQKAVVTVTPQGVIQFPQVSKLYPMMFLSSSTIFSPEENAKRFSFLSRRNRQHSVLRTIQSLFPLVTDISVEIVAGSPGLYASVVGLDEKIAVGSLSAGLTKYIAMLFGVASYPKGVIIVDEIENGFFYKKYTDVWRGIISLAAEHETQLFVSTHSIECLQAALPVVSENPSQFSLIRTERQEEECIVNHFSGKDLLAGLEQRIEFR